MKAIKFSLIAGALLAATGAAAAQPAQTGAQGRRGPAAEVTRDQAIARAEQRFARLDANRDGRLTAEEARQAMQAGMQQRQQRRAERRTQRQAQGQGQGQGQGQAFERLDTDRNGSISREEFAQRRALRGERGGRGGMRGMGGRGGERMGQRMFGEDGMITRDEFRARALQRFERLDANRDGRVTVAERREVRQRLREERRGRRQAPVQN
jgi:Ca2+-binding EF-hand superfamily protein